MRANLMALDRLVLPALTLLLAAQHALPAAHRMTVTVGAKPIGPVNRKIFGGCYNDVRERVEAWKYLGLTTCREGLPGLQSPGRLQPEPGVWKWKGYDAWLDWLKANDATGIALVSGAAKWMMKGGEKEPADWDYFTKAWSEYAAEVVRHTNIVRVLYFPCDTPGVYRVRFTGMREEAKVAAEAFCGSKAEAFAVSSSKREGAGVELRFDWPEGRRAVLKIRIRRAK